MIAAASCTTVPGLEHGSCVTFPDVFAWSTLAYLITAVTFMMGIKMLSSPTTARRGNQLAAFGMLIGLVTTVIAFNIADWEFIGPALVVGAVIGAVSARAVKMTAMPQMVALFNGMGAGAAALIGSGDFHANLSAPTSFLSTTISEPGHVGVALAISIVLSCFIGCLSFSGSLIAFGKLQELVTGRAVTYPGQKFVNGLILLAIVALAVDVVISPSMPALVAMMGLTLLLGIMFVIPIGGADMPVIISMLNSFTGLAAAATGFVISNNVLIVSGALVGASGTILTMKMSKAMNRSLFNVLFGAFGAGAGASGGAGAAAGSGGPVRSATTEDIAPLLAFARQVVFAPGYGMAVAHAQHDVKELADQLESRGVEVKYAIHPVAGRMPGHMNVLLAEAGVPYNQLREMDDINPEFSRTDVTVVIGANDVVNPSARSDPGSPIYGMPILNVDESQTVVVLKRSMATGFAGIDNPLFYNPKTLMLFGNARDSIVALSGEVKKQ